MTTAAPKRVVLDLSCGHTGEPHPWYVADRLKYGYFQRHRNGGVIRQPSNLFQCPECTKAKPNPAKWVVLILRERFE